MDVPRIRPFLTHLAGQVATSTQSTVVTAFAAALPPISSKMATTQA